MMSEAKKPIVLIFSDYYLPGYKSGGGMRTIVNMVDRLHDQFDFRIVTRDHDGKEDKTPYQSVRIDAWNEIGNARVFYLSKKNIGLSKIRELILEVKPAAIYINSYFATPSILVMVLRKLKKIPEIPVILANCGELSVDALRLKRTKKKIFINFSKRTGLHDNIIWKASSDLEKEEVEKVKGRGGRVFVAPDLPEARMNPDYSPDRKPRKKKGAAKMVFLSRFMKKKNFKWLLENLTSIEGELSIDIYGPIEDREYFEECRKLIAKLPENIRVEYRGAVPHEQVGEVMLKYHFFILPTISENFGHVFLEAMAAGCPLMISDRTPWVDLQKKGVGWDLPLEKPEKWREIFRFCLELDHKGFSEMSERARNYAIAWLADKSVEKKTIRILDYALDREKRARTEKKSVR